jgi:hypothetical protein
LLGELRAKIGELVDEVLERRPPQKLRKAAPRRQD